MKRIGFIGLGRMGLPMASNLVKNGFQVTGFDIDASRTELLAQQGGTGAASIADAVEDADIALSIVMDDRVLHAIALPSDGILSHLEPGAIYCDLSTVSPAASSEVGLAARNRGARYLCGKVAGSIDLARSAGLTLFASGEKAYFDEARPVFSSLAAKVHHVGADDSAAYLKLVHSLIVGVYSSMIGEALSFGERGGLDLETMIDILEAGPLGSRQLTLKAPILKARDFDDPPSDIDTAAKDVDLILATAKRDDMPLPLTSTVRKMMATAQEAGQGKRDIYAILETFERLSGGTRP
jgi:3-hydroxyisobutyrate dehydrogenase-like beta-hydroxyacid dehydrogenase